VPVMIALVNVVRLLEKNTWFIKQCC